MGKGQPELDPVPTLWGWLDQDCVAYHARVRPKTAACVMLAPGTTLSFFELDKEIARYAAALAGAVSKRGARVALLARNSLLHVVLFYASARAGLVFVPLNWRLPAAELTQLLGDFEPDILFADEEFMPTAAEAVTGPVRLLPAGAPLPAGAEVRWAPLSVDEPWILLYTSGTTGRPKGAIVTRRSAFFSSFNFAQIGLLTPGCATLCDAPLFHTVGLFGITHSGLTAGMSILISDRFIPAVTLERLSDPALGITHYFGVPQMAKALRDDPAYAAADLSQLKGFFCGGAPLSAALQRAFLEDGVPLSNGYGSTEGSTIMHVPLNREIALAKIGSCGLPTPAVEVRLVDLDGADVPAGEVGELWLRGPSVTPGYWRQPEATAAAFKDGWFRTGDAARQDEEGFYTLVDRWKDMFISGGENVYPAEVEAALLELEGVAEVAVVGVPDERWGETGVAYLVRGAASAVDEAAVQAFCKTRLAGYKRPALIRFVDSLPRNAAGKVRKQVLRAEHTDPTKAAG